MKSFISSISPLTGLIVICSIAVLAGCKKENDDSEVTADAGRSLSSRIGQEVTLDGTRSNNSNGKEFEYSWQFISKPGASAASLENATTASPSFTPDVQGKYRIELVVSGAGVDSDTVSVFAFKVSDISGTYENIIPGTNVGIRDFSIACQNLIATCEFTQIGGVAANKIAYFNGTAWNAMGCGLEEGSIYQMIEFDESLYVVGNFDEIGCTPANNIARWDCDSLKWVDLKGGLTGGDNPFGYSLEIYNNELYVGGQFTKAGNKIAHNIAKWDGSDWHSVGNIEGGSVREMKVYKDKLYVGGFFDTVNGFKTGHIASYDRTQWLAVGNPNDLELKSTGIVRHMAVYKNVLYISGDFSAGNENLSELSTWDGTKLSDFGRAFSGDYNLIYELAVVNDILYIGGDFRNVVASQANNIIQWDGESWGIMKQGISGNVLSIQSFRDKMYVGGDFDSAGGNTAQNISIWTED